MTIAPGSFAWLLAHDMRLNWRGLTSLLNGASTRKAVLILVACGTGLHLLAWPAIRWLSGYGHGTSATAPALAAIIGGVFMWMVAQSLFSATRALYDRADLDLLLGSPIPPARIIAAKAMSIMSSTLGSLGLLALPVANMGALIDSPGWLGVYPALIGMAMTATAIGLALSMALFFLVGPRRARVYAQMTGAVLGGSFVLGAQIFAMLPLPMRASIAAWIEHTGIFRPSGSHALLWMPVNAVHGDLFAMAVLLGIGVVTLTAAVKLLGERFAIAAIAAAGAPASDAGTIGGRLNFRAGLGRSLRLKELRLMTRDPSLFAQLSLQIIYTIPIAVVLLRSQLVPTAFALVPTIVVIAAQVAGSIAWLTVSGEDAPELIATAPVSPAAVDRAKLSAVALPMLAILALPLTGLALISWRCAAIALVFAACGCASTALLNFWHPMPGNRRGMLRRHQQSKLIGLVEHGLAILWAFAVVFALIGSVIALAPIAIVITILAVTRAKHLKRSVNGGVAVSRTQSAGSSAFNPMSRAFRFGRG